MGILVGFWLPILVSAVVVFIASSIMHMVLPYHRGDYRRLPSEEKVMAAVREARLKPALYMFPYGTHKDLKSPAMQEKFKYGPVGTMTIRPSGPIVMGKFLAQWFGFCLVVSYFTAYITGHAVPPGVDFLEVFRVASTVAFMAYGLGNLANGIWKSQPWVMTIKEVIDGLVYGLLTAGVFGWLWPR